MRRGGGRGKGGRLRVEIPPLSLSSNGEKGMEAGMRGEARLKTSCAATADKRGEGKCEREEGVCPYGPGLMCLHH